MLLSLFLGLSSIFGMNAQTVGSTGCSTPVCVFSNQFLRFGSGSENSVNAQGLFVQPWYFSEISNAWYKLTFANYPLDTAIGTGYGSAHWSGTTISDIYSLTPSLSITDYSNFIVNSSDATKTVGYGTIIANRTITLNSNTVVFQNIFYLGQNDKFVRIVTSLINTSPNILPNVLIWTGTRDDFVGTTDVNTKTRGNLNTGSFVPITAVGQSSYAIMISNTDEGVLFYSETPGVKTSFSSCCSFSNAYNTNPNTLAISTPNPTDGSYAAVLPFGDVQPGQTVSITWFYAAGTIRSLSSVAQNVAAAQVAVAGVMTSSPILSFSPFFSISATALTSVSPLFTYVPTNTSFYTPTTFYTVTSSASASASSTSTPSSTPTPSLTSTSSSTSTPSSTPTPSSTSTRTLSSTPTPSSTISITPTPTPTSTLSPSQTSTPTSTISTSPTSSSTSTSSQTSTISITPTTTSTPTPSTTISTSQTSTPSPTTSPTSTSMVQYIMLTNEQYKSMMQTNSDSSITYIIYAIVAVNIFFLVCLCVCCGCGLVYLNRRNRELTKKASTIDIN